MVGGKDGKDPYVYDSAYSKENLRTRSESSTDQLKSHRAFLKRKREVEEALQCSCKKNAYLIEDLRDQVQLCTEMLQAICKPQKSSKHPVGQFYLSQLLENVRHQHRLR